MPKSKYLVASVLIPLLAHRKSTLTKRETIPLPDRWRIMQVLGFKFPWYDPYNQNILKGDLPVGDDPWVKEHPSWFKRRPDGTKVYD